MSRRLRRAGSPWRVLAWNRADHGETAYQLGSDDHPGSEFDELVVGKWLHIEQMDSGTWWMDVGGVTLWVRADRDGRPRRVAVYAPGNYADAVEGCDYEVGVYPMEVKR